MANLVFDRDSRTSMDTLCTDLSQLDRLDEQAILQQLKARYEADQIYTKCGDILIAINPCKELPIFSEKEHEEHDWKNYSPDGVPHVFHIAGRAYQQMREMHANQVILVSGESGSGKTESTKLMVKHFVHMCHGGSKEFHDKIVKINPLLEAFGNAKTVMNHNSSRFAKYLELSFREDGHMTGAVVRDYMIEKSRVVLQNESEGNFHIFYSLFAGAPPERMRELNLKSAANYKIMQSCSSLLSKEQTRMYKKMYEEQMDVLESLDMEIEELDNIHFILAAIIHLTEVTFIDSQGTEGGVDIVNSQPDGPLGIAADLLDLQLESLGHALISMTTDFAGTVVRRFKSMEQAEDGRDAMAKALYERLFGWLVRQINQDIHPQKKRGESAASIGILDIAGFEKMKTNSFEQLCINMVNERLQNFMNDCLFKIELAIYKDEGIAMDNITFENNDPTIELFMKNRYGLFAILDEQTRLATGSAQAFVSIMNENLKDSDLYTPCEGKETMFGIRHFAGQIWYDADQFLEKNRDMLSKELVNCLKGSTNELISDLFTIKKGPTGTISATQYNWRASRKGPVPVLPHPKGRLTSKLAQLACDLRGTLVNKCGKVDGPALTKLTASKDHKTVVSYFQQSMSDLLGKMRVAEPFFIRCIKPNFGLVPKNFEDQKVLEQLVYTGVTGIAKIRRDGYAVRRDYPYFLLRYCRPLWPDAAKLSDTKEATRLVLLKSIPQSYHQDFRLGKYKVFMKEHVSVCMEKLLFKKQQFAAGKIATYYMQYLKRKKEKEIEDIRRNQSSIHSLQQDLNISSGSSSVTSSRISNPYDTAESKGSNGAAGNTGKVKPVKMGYRPPSPPVHIESEEEEPEEKKEAEQDENLFWDIFRVITREIKDRDVHAQRSMKIIKLITYFCFFCILLFAVVTQKISLMTLMFNMKVRDKDGTDLDKMKSMSRKANSRYIIVLVGMCIPYLLAFLTSLFKALFGNMPMPKIKSFVFCLVMESLHTFGLCQLTFRILPNMGMIHGILLLSSVAILPSILRLMCTAEPDSNKTDKCFKGQRGKIFSFILDLLVFFIQISSIPILVISKFMLLDDRAPIQVDAAAIIECVLALFFVSFSWWENFVDDKFCGQVKENKFWHKFIFTIKFDLQMSRPFINFITSAWKIGLSFLLAWAYRGNISFDIKDAFVYMDYSPIMSNASIIAFTISGFVAYYIAYVSCKLHLQIVSFALPLLLSTPVAVAAVQLHCEYGYLSALTSDFEEYDCVDLQGGEGHSIIDPWYHLLVSILWYLSLYWLARHIWFPSQERLAKVERIFLNPLYCGILTEQHFVLNRRRHNRNITRNWKYLKTASGEEKKIITFKLSKKEASPDLNEMEEADSANPYNAVKKKPNIIPTIYACATMWHENTLEMVQLMKSLFRLDKDQFVRKIAGSLTDDQTAECYEFEAHILFDDSMELNDDEERVPNDFVKQFVAILEEAASSVHEKPMTIKPPTKIPSPYGGQLIWELPFGNLMYLHMKDKNKIRHRKRWSQVMYMYYLLGYRIVRQCQEKVMQAIESDDFNTLISWDNVQKNATGNVGKSQIFEILDEEVNLQAANTYILALDGDVDFTPGAVRLLLDRMAKNEKVGAACGRIHPIGRGPMVWYQKFEYAVAHWLQKSTEHVLGCVLCSPGCFSLFRGSALMDDNVMRKYTIMPTEASHHLMYDQGEDRWLCTLLLQQGYRVDYAAASDAFTYAPEGFGEFFNQRRRWMPSTIANILDLLTDYRNTVTVNSNISMLYIFYQAALMVSTVIGPSTVLMMIAGAIMTVFNVGLLESYLISSAPAVFYSIICFTTKPAYQIIVAELLSAAYAFIMMIVLVGCVITGVMESPFHPSVMFLSSLVIIFAVSALAHPKEFTCIFYGLLYFLCIPSGFLLLVVYSLCNMNNVSWGTREVAQKKTKKQLEEEKKKREEEESLKKKKKGFFSRFWPSNQMGELKDLLGKLGDLQFSKKEDRTTQLLEQMNKNLKKLIKVQSGGASHDDNDDDDDLKDIVVEDEKPIRKGVQFSDDVTISMSLDSDEEEDKPIKKVKRDDLKNPAWIEENCLGKGMVLQMYEEECDFWKKFISKYLKPIEKNEKKEKQMTEALKELRNSACFGMMMINLLWMAINFMFQLKQPTIIDLPTYKPEGEIDNDYVMKVDALGLLFVMFFVIILVIQLVGMFIHRWGTFLHLISITELTNPLKNSMSKNKKEEEDKKDMIDFCEKIMSEPMPDYSSDEDGDDAVDQEDEEMKQRIHNKSKFGMDFDLSKSQRDFGKSLRQTMLQTPAGGRSVNLRQSMAAYLKQSRHQTAHGDEAPQGRDLINRFRSTLYNRQKLEERDENTPPALPSRRGQYSRRAFGYRQGTKLDMMNRARRRRLGQQYLSGERRRESPREMGRDDSDIYETIPFNGTMGRNFAKRLKKFKMAAEFDGNGNPRGYRDYRDYQRNNDGTMNHGFEMHDIESGYRNSQDAYL